MSSEEKYRDALEECLAQTAAERNDEIREYARWTPNTGTTLSGTDEIAAHLEYSDKMLAEVTNACTFNDPRMHDDAFRRRVEQLRGSPHLKELRDDIENTKPLLDEMLDQQYLENVQRQLCFNLIAAAREREEDLKLMFIDVTELEPRDAGKRVARFSGEWLGDVEPVDLTAGFEDVEPLPDDAPEDVLRP